MEQKQPNFLHPQSKRLEVAENWTECHLGVMGLMRNWIQPETFNRWRREKVLALVIKSGWLIIDSVDNVLCLKWSPDSGAVFVKHHSAVDVIVKLVILYCETFTQCRDDKGIGEYLLASVMDPNSLGIIIHFFIAFFIGFHCFDCLPFSFGHDLG